MLAVRSSIRHDPCACCFELNRKTTRARPTRFQILSWQRILKSLRQLAVNTARCTWLSSRISDLREFPHIVLHLVFNPREERRFMCPPVRSFYSIFYWFHPAVDCGLLRWLLLWKRYEKYTCKALSSGKLSNSATHTNELWLYTSRIFKYNLLCQNSDFLSEWFSYCDKEELRWKPNWWDESWGEVDNIESEPVK